MLSSTIELLWWHWLAFALVLLVVEMIAPGVFFLWFGVAAALVSLVVLVFEPSLAAQGVIFAVTAVVAAIYGRRLQKQWLEKNVDNGLNNRGQHLIGRKVQLVKELKLGDGAVKLDDTIWRCTGPDLPAGSVVEIVAVEGNTVKVRPTTT